MPLKCVYLKLTNKPFPALQWNHKKCHSNPCDAVPDCTRTLEAGHLHGLQPEPGPAVTKLHQLPPRLHVSRCHQWLSFTSWGLSSLSLANSNLSEQINCQSFLQSEQIRVFFRTGINCQCQLSETRSEPSSGINGKKSWNQDIGAGSGCWSWREGWWKGFCWGIFNELIFTSPCRGSKWKHWWNERLF